MFHFHKNTRVFIQNSNFPNVSELMYCEDCSQGRQSVPHRNYKQCIMNTKSQNRCTSDRIWHRCLKLLSQSWLILIVFSCRLCFPRAVPFISLIYSNRNVTFCFSSLIIWSRINNNLNIKDDLFSGGIKVVWNCYYFLLKNVNIFFIWHFLHFYILFSYYWNYIMLKKVYTLYWKHVVLSIRNKQSKSRSLTHRTSVMKALTQYS